jgi:hypothetical protein
MSVNKHLLKRIKIAKFAALLVFFIVQIFIVPRWCKADDSISDKTWCNRDKYQNSQIPNIDIPISFTIEMFALIILGKC